MKIGDLDGETVYKIMVHGPDGDQKLPPVRRKDLLGVFDFRLLAAKSRATSSRLSTTAARARRARSSGATSSCTA